MITKELEKPKKALNQRDFREKGKQKDSEAGYASPQDSDDDSENNHEHLINILLKKQECLPDIEYVTSSVTIANATDDTMEYEEED